jgi:hypothetical protein
MTHRICCVFMLVLASVVSAQDDLQDDLTVWPN